MWLKRNTGVQGAHILVQSKDIPKKSVPWEPAHQPHVSDTICHENCYIVQQGEIFSPANPASSDYSLAISTPLIAPLLYFFHYSPRNWINLKITRKGDRIVPDRKLVRRYRSAVSSNEDRSNFRRIRVECIAIKTFRTPYPPVNIDPFRMEEYISPHLVPFRILLLLSLSHQRWKKFETRTSIVPK